MKLKQWEQLIDNLLQTYSPETEVWIVTDSFRHGEVIATEIRGGKIYEGKLSKKDGGEDNIIELHLK